MPINAPNLIIVAFALHIRGAFLCIEIVDVNKARSNSGRKHMPTITESDLTAAFQLQDW